MMKKGWSAAAAALCAGLVSVSAAAVNSDAEFAGTAGAVAATAQAGRAELRSLGAAQAGGSVVRDQTTPVDVDLNAQTVKCSAADYSAPMLKVLVPGLADLTVLNHRNTREGAPCIAAGKCSATVGPQTILQSGAGTVRAPIRVVLKKVAAIDGDVCHVTLVETVTTQIRGVPFFHEREQAVADRAAADCR